MLKMLYFLMTLAAVMQLLRYNEENIPQKHILVVSGLIAIQIFQYNCNTKGRVFLLNFCVTELL